MLQYVYQMIHFFKKRTNMDKEKYLCDNFFLFKGVSYDNLSEIFKISGIHETKYNQGDIIHSCNHCDKIGVIVKGRAFVRSGVDGVILNKLNKNDIYGVASLFDTPSYSTIVQAVTDCTIITLSKEFILQAIAIDSVIALNYIKFLSQKITFLNKKINAFTAKSAENKLYTYLLQLPRNGNELELTVDMSTIAKMIGFGRATLYRALDKLEKSGTLTKKDKKIIFNEV